MEYSVARIDDNVTFAFEDYMQQRWALHSMCT